MLTIIGSHFYMAPEVYIGGGYDERVDLWALGVTLFQMVEGKTPFESEYHCDTVKNIRKGCFSFDSIRWNRYSLAIRSFIKGLLKPVEERLSILQAQKHIWLHSSQRQKFRRNSSFEITVHEDFHHEFKNNMINAVPKEEGNKAKSKKLFKSIKLLRSNTFELEDSDDEDSMVTPRI